MKKVCVSIVILYVIMMALMAETVLSQDIYGITPMIVGVILIVYAVILIIRERDMIDDTNEKQFATVMDEYKKNVKEKYLYAYKYRAEIAGLRHDYANHIQILMELLDSDVCPNRDNIIEKINVELIEKAKKKYSDNDLINLTLELKLNEYLENKINVDADISLYGLKNVDCMNLCYNLCFLMDVMTNYVSSDNIISLRLYVNNKFDNRIRIAYKIITVNDNKSIAKLKKSTEYRMFKELMDISGGTVITDIKDKMFTIVGWMEVHENV